jgi:hypothetical protein
MLYANTPDQVRVAVLFREAFGIYLDRDVVRDGLWQRDGALKMGDCAYDKIVRLCDAMKRGIIPDKDDALDAMNYLAFMILDWEDGNIERQVP